MFQYLKIYKYNMSRDFLKFVNINLKVLFKITTQYLTSWVLILHILYHLNLLRRFQYSLLLLSVLISLIGFYITYIYPKKLLFNNIPIEGNVLRLFDLLFHHLPLILLIIRYNRKIKNDNLIFALCVIILYLVFNDPIKMYNIMP